MDKRERAELFRLRLIESMALKGISRSALARETGVDRSTIGQLLKDDLPRLPNSQLAADVALALGVSTDWLLGLTNRPEKPSDIVAGAMALSPAERISSDQQLMQWHYEASGYKVRHVPATMPDILKTEKMLEWEYSSFGEALVTQTIDATRTQFEWLKSGVSDFEIAIPVHEIHACLTASAYYRGLPEEVRLAQLEFIREVSRELFPRLRIFLFDAHSVFSAPITVFGPNLCVIYIGQSYLAFREAERVRSLTDHFDWLVREAVVDARHVSDYIGSLLDEMEADF